jgi:hypothetical protein
MNNVTAIARNGIFNVGVNNQCDIDNTKPSSPIMTNVTASAIDGSTNNTGVYSYISSPTMTNVVASASGNNSENTGIYTTFSVSQTLINVTARASGGTTRNYGINNLSPTSLTMTNVTASASGGGECYGVYNENTVMQTTMTNVTASAKNGTNNYGMFNVGLNNGPFIVGRSTFEGATYSIVGNNLRIGASKLVGGELLGSATCIGVYNGDTYTGLDSTCH